MKNIIIVGGLVVVIIILGLVYFSQRGTVLVEINKLSPITEDIDIYIARRQFPQPFRAPFSQKLRPGKYVLIALAPRSNELKEEFIIKNGQITSLKLTLTEDFITGDELELTPTSDELANNKLLKIFPHLEANYEIRAKLDRNSRGEIYVSSLVITPYLPIPAGQPYDRDEVLQAKNAYVQEAKDWLRSQNIPEDTATIIDSII